MNFDRITQTPGVIGGKARIKGTRISVSTILSQLSAGESIDELLIDYPHLAREDILQALLYGAEMSRGSLIDLEVENAELTPA